MIKRTNIGASVVKQANARVSAIPNNVIPLKKSELIPGHPSLYSRLEYSNDPKSGALRLRVIFLGNKDPDVFDLSFLLIQPELGSLFAEGFMSWGNRVAPASRTAFQGYLRTGFGKFLLICPPDINPWTLDEAFWTSFVRWLDAPRLDKKPYAVQTRRKCFGAVNLCLQALTAHAQFGKIARYLLDQSGFPRNLWPGSKTKAEPVFVLTPAEKDQTIRACLREIAVIADQVRDRTTSLAKARERIDQYRLWDLPIEYDGVDICAASLEEQFPDRFIQPKDLIKLDKDLANGIKKHGLLNVRSRLYTTSRQLVPFVILLGFKTAFNPETLLTLDWSNIDTSYNGEFITITGIKGRAAKAQINSDYADHRLQQSSELPAEPGEGGGLAQLLETLKDLTERTRRVLAVPEHADRLFIYAPVFGSNVVKSFDDKGGAAASVWPSALLNFINDNKLQRFSLKNLRSTEGDEEFRRTGDPLAVMRLLGHKNAQTVRNHYTSDWMLKRGQERIAETQSLYHRWSENDGRTDPRGQPEFTIGAATPGFLCLDPYDSPRSGQQSGKLCSAYGECPSCPLAGARPQDPKLAALYIGLKAAIHLGAQGRISASAWQAKWKFILEDLEYLLVLIPPSVLLEAARYRVKIKPVG